jgi:hypothetical protein
MIDLPYGAVGRISGNLFVSGRQKDNYGTMIAVAAEDRLHSSAGLVIERNRAWLAPGFRWRTSFVGNWSGDKPAIRDNDLAPGISELQRHWPVPAWLRERLRR